MIRSRMLALTGSDRRKSALSITALLAVLAAIAVALVQGTTSVAAQTSSKAALPPLSQVLAKGYAGDYDLPPSTGPKAVRGKNVWYISCGQAFAACANMSKAFQAAGKILGWNVSVKDGAASPNTAASIIRQALAAKVDGVALVAYDCPGIKSALLQAKAAKVPVVTFNSLDCNDPAFGGKRLFTASLNERGSSNQADLNYNWNKARADFTVAKWGCKGKLLQIGESSQRIHYYMVQGFKNEMKARCPNRTVVQMPFTFSQVPVQFGQNVKAALLKNPDAAVLSEDTDALMFLGLETALKQAAPKNMYVAGAEGLPQNIPLIRSGVQDSATYFPFEWFLWGLADTLNRIFAGDNPATLPSEGGGWQFIDKTHNLPPAGKVFHPSVKFEQIYTKVWRGK